MEVGKYSDFSKGVWKPNCKIDWFIQIFLLITWKWLCLLQVASLVH